MSSQNEYFKDLTEDELKSLVEEINKERQTRQGTDPNQGSGGGDPAAPQRFQVMLPTGESFTGTQEEVNRKFSEVYQAQEQRYKAQTQQGAAPTTNNQAQSGGYVPPQWDQSTQETVVRKMGENFYEGMKEYNRRIYQLDDPIQVIGAILQKQNEEVIQLKAMLASQVMTSKYKELSDPENQKVVDSLREQYKIPNTPEGLEQVYWMAKGQGKFKTETPKEETKQTPQDTGFKGTPHNPDPNYYNSQGYDPSLNPYMGGPPPHVGQGAHVQRPLEPSPEAVLEYTRDMPLEDLRELANRVGQMKGSGGIQ